MTTAPLSSLRISLVGPGRVGCSVAGWARAAGAEVVQVAARRAGGLAGENAGELAGFPLEGARWTDLSALSTAGEDLLLVSVPDSAVASVAAGLAGRPQARVALHTAGALDASALAPLRAAGCEVGSFHPLKAFPRPLPDPAEARGIFFALDGDPAAVEMGRRMAAAWGGASAVVPAAARPLYHLAASLAAGGAVTLLALASEISRRLGLPAEVGQGYAALAQGAIAAAARAADPAEALTGPVARGDLGTFGRQVDALAAAVPERVPLILQLARETLRQQARLGGLDAGQAALLAEVERRLAGGGGGS